MILRIINYFFVIRRSIIGLSMDKLSVECKVRSKIVNTFI